ncbi:MAG: ABC transporter ATP-binding protein [Candidatus Limnocylindria bacterium]
MESTNYAEAPPPRTPATFVAEPAIASLREATVVLDDRAVLRRATLELVPGITLLRGANGAGKTTALRALAGLVPLARGERDVPQDVLYLGHRPQLVHGLTARENLRFLSQLRGLTASVLMRSSDDPRDDLSYALDRWGLHGDADRPVERLSAGQRRRAALARLDTETCELALLDEPFAELDAEAAGLLRGSLTEPTAPRAILIASHGHAELDGLAVRTYEVEAGSVTLVGSR